MINWLKQLWSWLAPKVRQLFVLTAAQVAAEVLDILNNETLQQQALAAVKAAAAGGLKGNDAFEDAAAHLRVTLAAEGRELKTNLIDTLIQNAYCVFKNGEEV